MTNALKVAVAGLGTVGAGTLTLLAQHARSLERRTGRPITVVAVSARERSKDRGVAIDDFAWYDDAVAMAREADADVVVELIGGADGIAKEVCRAAVSAGRHVVTANKALLAHSGSELALAAEDAGVTLAYEAAVAGGIPAIKALREGLAGNCVTRVYGILNGTSNYVLTAMRESGREFEDVLGEAQDLGYAEADPSFDVDGIDAAHKLAILASVAFGCRIDFDGVYVEGIRRVAPLDIRFADELGYRIKLLGIATQTKDGIEQRVHPCMVPLSAPIANIDGVFNAVVADGDFMDTLMQEGRGAGAGPTASAVVADLVDIARGRTTPTFGVPARELGALTAAPMARHRGAYYVRLMVVDRPGVFADVAAALRDNEISMEAVLQRARAPEETVPVVLTTHETDEAAMMRAVEAIERMDTVAESPRLIRIEPL
ncbi:MAG: homoserine dehydrogenase [Rhodospirillales bacterium]|jgi:homoserine dehydrogenase|nr:homoserine dehydrogenase [Rhodospirillales bacterium]MDP6805796.1 homoserine dehydrogenase [Rhodospirillales bacterium]